MQLDFVITMLLPFVSANHFFRAQCTQKGQAKLGAGGSQSFDNNGDHDHDHHDRDDKEDHHHHH